MPGGDSTGPAGQGPGIGRSNEHIERLQGQEHKSFRRSRRAVRLPSMWA